MAMTRTQQARRSPLARLHAYAKAQRRTRRRARQAGSLGRGPAPTAWRAAERAAPDPVGYFGPQHGLTPAQASEANRLLARANRLRPLRGRYAAQRSAARIAGIISAVKGGRVGNARFGRSLHGHRGGRVMAVHALHHLRAIARLGRQAAPAKRAGKQVQQAWDRQQRQAPTYEAWQQAIVEWPVEPSPKDFMAW